MINMLAELVTSNDLRQEDAWKKEEHDVVYSQRSKLFRFRHGQWKELGLGDAKLIKNKSSGNTRFIFRDEKTMKIESLHHRAKSVL